MLTVVLMTISVIIYRIKDILIFVTKCLITAYLRNDHSRDFIIQFVKYLKYLYLTSILITITHIDLTV